MAIGASGLPIVVFCRVVGTTALPAGGVDILASYQLSEATIGGATLDGRLSELQALHVDFEPTDSEIEVALREAMAVRLSTDFDPAVFIATDIRGMKI